MILLVLLQWSYQITSNIQKNLSLLLYLKDSWSESNRYKEVSMQQLHSTFIKIYEQKLWKGVCPICDSY